MRISIRGTTGDLEPVNLVRNEEDFSVWESTDSSRPLTIKLGDAGRPEKVVIFPWADVSEQDVSDQFVSQYAEYLQLEAAGIEFTQDGDVETEGPFPYDPEAIRVDTKTFNLGLVHEMINDGDINLSPDFQRQFVWTDLGTRSRLIESIMLRIPLPVFYFSQEPDGSLQVVDGLQRLTVINQFLNNKLRLRDVEYLSAENGKLFRDDDPSKCIDQRYRKRILQTQIMANIIDPQTPSNVKFDIFKRINQGGRPLNAQEMRNCMSTSDARALISSLAESDEFLLATGGSVGKVRLQDHELILRFLAFRMAVKGLLPTYPGNMERYLDEAIHRLNRTPTMHNELGEDFKRSMVNSHHLFGPYAFRKCFPDDVMPGARRRLINNSYFTTWSVTLANYPTSSIEMIESGSFAMRLASELNENEQLYDAVTSGTNDRRRLEYAFHVSNMLTESEVL